MKRFLNNLPMLCSRTPIPFRSETYDLQQDLLAAGQLKDAVQLFDLKKMLKVICGIYSQLFGQNKTFCLRVDVADTDDVNVQKGKRSS